MRAVTPKKKVIGLTQKRKDGWGTRTIAAFFLFGLAEDLQLGYCATCFKTVSYIILNTKWCELFDVISWIISHSWLFLFNSVHQECFSRLPSCEIPEVEQGKIKLCLT